MRRDGLPNEKRKHGVRGLAGDWGEPDVTNC